MFDWLRRLFSKPKPTAPVVVPQDHALYMPEQRKLFHYFDGEKVVRVDPIEQYRKYAKVRDEIEIARSVAASQSKDAEMQYLVMLAKIRELFSIPALGQTAGLTEQETVDLYSSFVNYCLHLKKNGGNSATSA